MTDTILRVILGLLITGFVHEAAATKSEKVIFKKLNTDGSGSYEVLYKNKPASATISCVPTPSITITAKDLNKTIPLASAQRCLELNMALNNGLSAGNIKVFTAKKKTVWKSRSQSVSRSAIQDQTVLKAITDFNVFQKKCNDTQDQTSCDSAHLFENILSHGTGGTLTDTNTSQPPQEMESQSSNGTN